ncbi:MAG: hypothetical protein ACJAZS_000056 [Alteromonas naphthalenivorans]|jgi:hypothetical protein
MHGNRTLFALLLVTLSPLFSAEADATRSTKANPTQAAPNAKYINVIDKYNFRAKGQVDLITTFSITTPGSYYLTENIGYQGRNTSLTANLDADPVVSACAIYVDSSDVVIDLGNYTLYNNSGATLTSNQTGIIIAPSKYNVVVRNGNITGFQDTGILVRTNCDDVRMQNLTITQCVKNGIYLDGDADANATTQNMITNCIIENSMVGRSKGLTGTDAVGLRMDNCINILVNDSAFNRCDTGTVQTVDAYGALITSCTNVVFTNCDASGNHGKSGAGFTVETNSSACSFINCTANGNWGAGTTGDRFGQGFAAVSVNGCLWENCTANANQGNAVGYGFALNTAKYCKTTKCESSYNNAGSAANIAGGGGRSFYSISGEGNIWDECEAIGSQISLSAITAAECIGFDLQTETHSIIQNCISRNQNSNSNAAWGIGINLYNTDRCVIDNCSITHNRSATQNQGIGLLDNKGANSSALVTRCFFFNNGDEVAPNTAQNFHLDYNPGEFNITTTVNQGSMGSLTGINPYQNVSLEVIG